ncbi:hypothetical protein V1521DRAFT_427648, partial [Lipomyces starkeyi]
MREERMFCLGFGVLFVPTLILSVRGSRGLFWLRTLLRGPTVRRKVADFATVITRTALCLFCYHSSFSFGRLFCFKGLSLQTPQSRRELETNLTDWYITDISQRRYRHTIFGRHV